MRRSQCLMKDVLQPRGVNMDDVVLFTLGEHLGWCVYEKSTCVRKKNMYLRLVLGATKCHMCKCQTEKIMQ